MKSLCNLLLLPLVLLFCFSCSKEEDPEYEPYVKGSIIGYAMLTNQYGNVSDDHSGITVYIEPGRKYPAKTDITGRFEIKGVPTGTYNLSFEKEGFGTMSYPEVHHLGGKPTILGMPTSSFPWWTRIVLHEYINLQITDMYIFQENRVKIDVPLSGSPFVDDLYIRLFFSDSDGFATKDADYTADVAVYETGGYFDDVAELPFESGTTVYCRGSFFTYGATIMLAEGVYAVPIDTYKDETSGTTILPNLTAESDQYAFVMP